MPLIQLLEQPCQLEEPEQHNINLMYSDPGSMSGADTYCSIPLQRAVCGFGDITIGWISVRFDTDILVPLGMNFNFFNT